MRRRPHDEQAERVHRQVLPPTSAPADRSSALQDMVGNRGLLQLLRSSRGVPLPGATRSLLEDRFGQPLGEVRVHADSSGDRVARSVDADAVTVGRDIAFRAGLYDPGTRGGMSTLAHEVAHAVQQRDAPIGGPLRVSDPDSRAEREADRAAEAVTRGARAPALGRSEAMLARQRRQAVRPPPVVVDPEAPLNRPIGDQNAYLDPKDINAQVRRSQAKAAANVATAQAEVPVPVLECRETAVDDFIRLGATTRTAGGKVEYEYTPRYFHLLDAMIYDLTRVNAPEDAYAVLLAYLADTGLTKLEYQDGDGKQRKVSPSTSTKVPWTLQWDRLNDPGAAIRLDVFFGIMARRAEEVPALAPVVPPGTAPLEPGQHCAKGGLGHIWVTLHLPASKERHLALYQAYAKQGRLVHRVGSTRPSTNQVTNWKEALRPGSWTWDGMDQAAYDRGLELVGGAFGSDDLVLIPNWSDVSAQVEMQVDHIVELQVTNAENDGGELSLFDSIDNYQLLDASTNVASRNKIVAAIKRERKRLETETGDPGWATRPLVFNYVVADLGGAEGEQWSKEEIRDGEHIKVLEDLWWALGLR